MIQEKIWQRPSWFITAFFVALSLSQVTFADTSGSISGSVFDDQNIAVSQAQVQIKNLAGGLVKKTNSSTTGTFQVFPIDFGDYDLSVQSSGFLIYSARIHVNSGAVTEVTVNLAKSATQSADGHEMVLDVRAKRHLVQTTSSQSSAEIDQDRIQTLPEANQIKLPKLLASTSPGVVPGPFGQSFIRGNHANIQYQIDGVQLPDSPSNTFGEAFSPRNIDHMEVITGGIPAEYGERLAAVVNIISKTGPEEPAGTAEINYGSYNTTSPEVSYGGSNKDGNFHYYFSANFFRTDRGLDTPEPVSEGNQGQGGTDAIHDESNGNSEFAKLDWIYDNENKFTMVVFDSRTFYQIPTYPSSFSASDPFFSNPNFSDQWGNGNFFYTPPNTNDSQLENNDYAIISWKHTLSENAFFKIAPYVKASYIIVANDPANDLSNNAPASFAENRKVMNYGLSSDYTNRLNNEHKLKAGFQIQSSTASGGFNIITSSKSFSDDSNTYGTLGAVYVQDDYTINKRWSLNAGLRFSALQSTLGDLTPGVESSLQPRIGLNFLADENTKLHVFYGRLFQPAPLENLRDAFSTVGGGTGTPYDIKPERDNYYETGVAHQFGESQVATLNVYYKQATDMLDDTQLLNSAISQPFNFQTGFATGIELSVKGDINTHLSEYLNYSFEVAKGKGISGGIFAFDPSQLPPNTYQYLDHVQLHTLNSGWTYKRGQYFGTAEALYGSGLRTGTGNSLSLPGHLTFDLTAGYEFKSENWIGKFKVSGDILNITDNRYPISVANGFNGSHYAAGREFFIHLVKDL